MKNTLDEVFRLRLTAMDRRMLKALAEDLALRQALTGTALRVTPSGVLRYLIRSAHGKLVARGRMPKKCRR